MRSTVEQEWTAISLPYQSPLLEIIFESGINESDELIIRNPDSTPFENPSDWKAERDRLRQKLIDAGINPDE